MQRLTFWGIPVSAGTPVELALYLKRRLSPRRPFFIATPNPEMMLASRRDRLLKKVLAQLTFNIPDGAGLAWALGRTQPGRAIKRIPGVEFMETLLAVLPAGQRVLLLGGRRASVTSAAARLSRTFRQHIFSALPGEIPAFWRLKPAAQNLRHFRAGGQLKRLILKERPTVIFAGLGSPLQEKWLAANRRAWPSSRLLMGVGGAFDIISGLKPRAPRFLRRLGLEWLWRLAQEPKRLRRIFRAVVVFPLLVLLGKK